MDAEYRRGLLTDQRGTTALEMVILVALTLALMMGAWHRFGGVLSEESQEMALEIERIHVGSVAATTPVVYLDQPSGSENPYDDLDIDWDALTAHVNDRELWLADTSLDRKSSDGAFLAAGGLPEDITRRSDGGEIHMIMDTDWTLRPYVTDRKDITESRRGQVTLGSPRPGSEEVPVVGTFHTLRPTELTHVRTDFGFPSMGTLFGFFAYYRRPGRSWKRLQMSLGDGETNARFAELHIDPARHEASGRSPHGEMATTRFPADATEWGVFGYPHFGIAPLNNMTRNYVVDVTEGEEATEVDEGTAASDRPPE